MCSLKLDQVSKFKFSRFKQKSVQILEDFIVGKKKNSGDNEQKTCQIVSILYDNIFITRIIVNFVMNNHVVVILNVFLRTGYRFLHS